MQVAAPVNDAIQPPLVQDNVAEQNNLQPPQVLDQNNQENNLQLPLIDSNKENNLQAPDLADKENNLQKPEIDSDNQKNNLPPPEEIGNVAEQENMQEGVVNNEQPDEHRAEAL